MVVTLILLFSGFFTFQWLFIEKPIQKMILKNPSIHIDRIEVQPQLVRMSIEIPNGSLFNYPALFQAIQAKVGNRKLEIELKDRTNSTLEKAWNEIAFGVKEGIDKKEYTQIQKSVKEVSSKLSIQHEVLLRDSSVFITLKQGDYYLYKVIDLQSEKEVKIVD